MSEWHYGPFPYVPKHIVRPYRVLTGDYGTSAWEGLESILCDLVIRFCRGRSVALEVGVEHGYSAVALSNFFENVFGIDIFEQTTTDGEPMEERARKNCAPFPNIHIAKLSWQDFIAQDSIAQYTEEWPQPCSTFDLIHIDGEHDYEQTFGFGDWALQHSPVVIFHDTNNLWVDVPRAIRDLCEKHKRYWFQYPHHEGLGIVVTPELAK